MKNEIAPAATSKTPAVYTIQDMTSMARAFAASGMFGVKNPEQALSLLLVAQSEGIHPAQAMMQYHVIQGKPALSADAQLARHQAMGGTVEWLEYTDSVVTGRFTYRGSIATVSWDDKKVAAAGLAGKDNWRKFPAAMRRARCISEGVRTVNPGATLGFYIPDEVEEFSQPADPGAKLVEDCIAAGDYQKPEQTRKPDISKTKPNRPTGSYPKDDEIPEVESPIIDAEFEDIELGPPLDMDDDEPMTLDEAAAVFADETPDTREEITITGVYLENRDGKKYVDKNGNAYTQVRFDSVQESGAYAAVWQAELDWKEYKDARCLADVERKSDQGGKMWYSLHNLEKINA